jgi:DNA-binding transcriptional MerR regulator
MHAAYTKTREDLKRGREAYSTVQRFYSDPDYQLQVLQQAAAQRGMRLSSIEQAAQAQTNGQTAHAGVQAPADFVERIKGGLAPELQWMAPQLAAAQWAAIQPLIQERQHEKLASKTQELESAEAEFAQQMPGWEAEEEDMNNVLEWLQSGSPKHQRWGNRYAALHKLTLMLKGHNGHAVQEAANRMAEAARSRTTSSGGGRPAGDNYQERVLKAATGREAMEFAQKQAIEELKRQGVAIPD